MMSIVRFLLPILLPITLVALFVEAQQPDTEMATAKMVGASNVAPVFFDPGAKVLTATEKAEMQAFVTTIRETQEIKSIKVLAWGDREYPDKKEKKASPKQIELAKARAEAIKKYLQEDLKVPSVDIHNMAERPSKLSEFFKTDDYEVKTSAEATGAAPTQNKRGFFEEMGRSTTALMLVVVE
ncbi:OmpA family protein [Bdellovibrio sp. HCB117]|uniref:OmpA family protein n=1 Tax=Bdellovibrio sp. HCB117 TaxID=3394359 RepID=UPI0039B67F79